MLIPAHYELVLYWDLMLSQGLTLGGLLASGGLEHDKTREGNGVTKDLEESNGGSESQDGSTDEKLRRQRQRLLTLINDIATHDILGDTSQSEDQARSDRDQEDSSNLHRISHCTFLHNRQQTYVEGKGHSGVGEEDQEPNPVQSIEGLKSLNERKDDEVDDCANGSVVV